MDQKIPFTSYDFWAYLSSGFLLLFAIDQMMGTKLLIHESWTGVQGVIAVSVAYTAGHLVASASLWLYESLLVDKLLGHPCDILFGQPKAWALIRKLIPTYFEALPIELQKTALIKGSKFDINNPGKALFWLAHTNGRNSPETALRLDNFLNLYGFCRNTALVSLINSIVLYWSYLQPEGPTEHLLWARISLAVSLGMTLRYLKFYRHFTLELFTSWIFSKSKEEELNP